MVLVSRPDAPGLEAGFDEALIGALVDHFYGMVRQDSVLGPIFEARVKDWDDHLAKLRDFWSSVLLMSGRYKGRPMPVHAAIQEISDEHFERWLELFKLAAKHVCQPKGAALVIDRASRIGESLRMGIKLSRGDDSFITRPRRITAAT